MKRDVVHIKPLITGAIAIVYTAALAVPTLSAILDPPFLRAQSGTDTVARFSSASIRQSIGCVGAAAASSETYSLGRLQLKCWTLGSIIWGAYVEFAGGKHHALHPVPIEGRPDWLGSTFYDLDATTDATVSHEIMRGPMMVTLLEDRFKLKVHREMRAMAVYELKIAEGGPRFRSCAAPGSSACQTMSEFCEEYAAFFERPLVDKTGLTGTYLANMELNPHDLAPEQFPNDTFFEVSPNDPDQGPISVTKEHMETARRNGLQKLGLDIKPAIGPGEFLVIDHVERRLF